MLKSRPEGKPRGDFLYLLLGAIQRHSRRRVREGDARRRGGDFLRPRLQRVHRDLFFSLTVFESSEPEHCTWLKCSWSSGSEIFKFLNLLYLETWDLETLDFFIHSCSLEIFLTRLILVEWPFVITFKRLLRTINLIKQERRNLSQLIERKGGGRELKSYLHYRCRKRLSSHLPTLGLEPN